MADGRTARPVSGEIVTAARGMASPRKGNGIDVIDADFEVLAGCAARTSPDAGRPPMAEASPAAGMDMLRRNGQKPARGRPRPFERRAGPVFWIVGAGLIFAAFWVSGGHAWLRHLPLAGGAQAAGFSISGVRSRVETAAGRAVLFVDGEAMNHGAQAAVLPALEIHVTGEDGRATLYKLGTSQTPLAPGGRFAFSSRLAVPKNGVKTVTVAFGE